MPEDDVVGFISKLSECKAENITVETLIDWVVDHMMAAGAPVELLTQFAQFVPAPLLPYLQARTRLRLHDVVR